MFIMNKINNINGIDFNLLVVLDALLTERHVTRAGERINLTQPAVSHALNRLRLVFGDRLFVRSAKGMQPTPKALELGPRVRSVLADVEGILDRRSGFVPAASRRIFTLGLSDYVASVILPGLIGRMKEVAPFTSIIVKNANYGTGTALLEDGQVELIAGSFPEPPAYVTEELLFREGFVCAARKGLQGFERGFNRRRYLAFDHLQVSGRGDPYGVVDAVLAKESLQRKVTVTVGQFLLAPLLLQGADFIATEPKRLFLAHAGELTLRKPPLDIPEFDVAQMWHSRLDADPGHIWLRKLLKETVLDVR